MSERKIVSPEELTRISEELKKEGKKIALCHGCFDLIHPGHLAYFKEAKRLGDVLVVSVTCDACVEEQKGPGRPVIPQKIRAGFISEFECVDYVIINGKPTVKDLISAIKPDFYVKGSEFTERKTSLLLEEEEAVRKVGGKICFLSGEIILSSTEIINRYFDIYPEALQKFLEDFRKRYSAKEIIAQFFQRLKSLKILAIGETIIDDYHYGRPLLGKPSKGSGKALEFLREESFAGGVLACANHVAGFCDDVYILSLLGGMEDSKESFIRRHLKPNITPFFFYRDDIPTIIKRRFLEDGPILKKELEFYYFNDSPLPPDLDAKICRYLSNVIGAFDVVIVTDYGHGFFSRNIIELLSEKSKFLAVNAQTNSANPGFNLITKYPRADYVCVDELELRWAAHERFEEVDSLTAKVANLVKTEKMIVTRGHLGSTTYDAIKKESFKIPVLSTRVVDPLGAGDAFLAVTSPCVAAGFPMDLVGFIGNAVGAIAVTIVGNKSSVEPEQLFNFINTLLK